MAQKSIKGILTDSTHVPMPGATVILSLKSNSALVAFTRSNPQGDFELKSIPQGNYLLRISFVGYKTYEKELNHSKEVLDLGKVIMKTQVYSGSEVVIEAKHEPMTVRGDTLEFNASSFKVAAGSILEQLLKKLPGFVVDADGTVRAMGKVVEKIVVNGKEFFGLDPTIATQNLPADIIKTIKLYDDKSDNAKFTKVDDGVTKTTLNIVLKEDKLKGYFGSIVGGYGTQSRYVTSFMLNRFTGKTQFTILSGLNNISNQTIGMGKSMAALGIIREANSRGYAGSAMGQIQFRGQGFMSSYSYGNSGLSTTGLGGINISHSPNEKTTIELNYLSNSQQLESVYATNSRQTLNETEAILNNGDGTENTSNRANFMGMNLKHSITTQKQLQVYGTIAQLKKESKSDIQRNSRNVENVLINQSLSAVESLQESYKMYGGITYRRAFQKKGRSLVSEINLNGQTDEIGENNKAKDSFFTGITSTSDLNQKRDTDRTGTDIAAKFTYNEPLAEGKTLQFVASVNQNVNNQDLKVFDVLDLIETPNASLSTQYRHEYVRQEGTAKYISTNKKQNLQVGITGKNVQMLGDNLTTGKTLNRNYFYFLPSASFKLNFAPQSDMDFSYNSSMTEPSLEQLQPIQNNRNTLIILEGNPDLRPSTRHNLEVSLSSYSTRYISVRMGAAMAQNTIRQSKNIDSQFRQIVKYVNGRNSLSSNGSVDFSIPINLFKSYTSYGIETRYQQLESIINGKSESGNYWENIFDFRMTTMPEFVKSGKIIKDMSLELNAQSRQNRVRYEKSTSGNLNYWQHFIGLEMGLEFQKDFSFNSKFGYNFYPQSDIGTGQAIPLWEVSMFKLLMKSKLKAEIMAFDILNRNQDVRRMVTSSFVSETRSQVINQYALLRLSYSLAGFGK
jgi:subtilisin family serine protease